MNPGFYQHYWDIVGAQVTQACMEVINNGSLLEQWKTAHIVLIPKKEMAENLSNLQPIALCNVYIK